MDQNNYADLLTRILQHCRKVACDMELPDFGWIQQEEKWVRVEQVGKYVREHKSFVTFTKTYHKKALVSYDRVIYI